MSPLAALLLIPAVFITLALLIAALDELDKWSHK